MNQHIKTPQHNPPKRTPPNRTKPKRTPTNQQHTKQQNQQHTITTTKMKLKKRKLIKQFIILLLTILLIGAILLVNQFYQFTSTRQHINTSTSQHTSTDTNTYTNDKTPSTVDEIHDIKVRDHYKELEKAQQQKDENITKEMKEALKETNRNTIIRDIKEPTAEKKDNGLAKNSKTINGLLLMLALAIFFAGGEFIITIILKPNDYDYEEYETYNSLYNKPYQTHTKLNQEQEHEQ